MPVPLPVDRVSLSSNDYLHYGLVVPYLNIVFRSLLDLSNRTIPPA